MTAVPPASAALLAALLRTDEVAVRACVVEALNASGGDLAVCASDLGMVRSDLDAWIDRLGLRTWIEAKWAQGWNAGWQR